MPSSEKDFHRLTRLTARLHQGVPVGLFGRCGVNVFFSVLSFVAEPGGNRYSDEMGDIPISISNRIRTDTSVSDSLSTQCQPPQFLHRSPLEITALESEPLTVRCIVEGNPKPVGMTVFLLFVFLQLQTIVFTSIVIDSGLWSLTLPAELAFRAGPGGAVIRIICRVGR